MDDPEGIRNHRLSLATCSSRLSFITYTLWIIYLVDASHEQIQPEGRRHANPVGRLLDTEDRPLVARCHRVCISAGCWYCYCNRHYQGPAGDDEDCDSKSMSSPDPH